MAVSFCLEARNRLKYFEHGIMMLYHCSCVFWWYTLFIVLTISFYWLYKEKINVVILGGFVMFWQLWDRQWTDWSQNGRSGRPGRVGRQNRVVPNAAGVPTKGSLTVPWAVWVQPALLRTSGRRYGQRLRAEVGVPEGWAGKTSCLQWKWKSLSLSCTTCQSCCSYLTTPSWGGTWWK